MEHRSIISILLAAIISMVIVWTGLAHRIGEVLGRKVIWVIAILTPILALTLYLMRVNKSRK